MMILATKWTTAWLMTGLGFGAVFSILVLLVLLLQIFSYVAAKSEVKPKARFAGRSGRKTLSGGEFG